MDPHTLGLQEKRLCQNRWVLILLFSACGLPAPPLQNSFYSETGPGWHWDLLALVLSTWQIQGGGAPPSQDPDLVDSPEHVYLGLWWMNQICSEIQMCFRSRISGAIKLCLLFVPLTGTWTSCLVPESSLMCLPFSWIWVHGGQEPCVNSLDQQLRARYLTYGIRVNLVKWMCTHSSHSSSSTPSQTLSYSCSEMYLHFRLMKGCKDLTLSLSQMSGKSSALEHFLNVGTLCHTSFYVISLI